ncbi:MAG: beta-ketoacyl-ACP synthase III [Lachnospiraceae bacterium]|nr:beta-ketoacyl-ACP synthase III [Lachnospiraceae bacterium]
MKIKGTGSFLPDRIATNHDLEKIVDTNDEWIRSRTGIKERRISIGDSTADMAVKAAQNALKDAGMKAEQLDMIITATLSGDHATPSTACQVQGAIGAINAVCFDLNAACSGFLYSMATAQAYMASGMAENVLVIGVETLSKLIDWNDRSTCVLFGDGAGAAVVVKDDHDMKMVMGSDGSKGMVLTCGERKLNNCYYDGEKTLDPIAMNGQEVFRFAVKTVPKCVKEVLAQAGKTVDDIDHYLLHQANKRIIESVSKRLKVPMEKFPMNLMHCGNTSSASIPILLDEVNKQGLLKRGDSIVLCGFGGGLTWGAIYLEW